MRDVLVLIDVVNSFEHRDGDALLASFRDRLPALQALLRSARRAGVPVVYANDDEGRWDADAPGLVARAVAGRGGDAVRSVAPGDDDRVVLKHRYSAFDHTGLVLLLRELEAERLLMAGAATEMCVVQSAIDARELGFKVTIVPDACSGVSPEDERLALDYAERVVGIRLTPVSELEPGVAEPE